MSVDTLLTIIKSSLTSPEQAWLENVLVKLQESDDPLEDLLLYSAMVRRKINSVSKIENTLINTSNTGELARIALYGYTRNHSDLSIVELIKGLYQGGDSSEKAALLTGLEWLDPKGEAVEIAVRAARCNSLDEFTALALNNLYPSRHFADLNFNQLVLKTLFLGVEIEDLLGLDNRLSPELSNMCFSYVVEQALADRVPPASIWIAITQASLTSENQADFEQYIQHFSQRSLEHKVKIQQLFNIQG